MAQSLGTQASRLGKDFILAGPPLTKLPKLVYGTAWKKERTADLVYAALKTGFRGIDTAAQPKHYDEAGVGAGFRKAVVDGLVKREDVFIQTKFTSPAGQNHITPYDLDAPLAEKVHQSVQSSLRNFTIEGQEPYLDSVVLHSPMHTYQDTVTVWQTLETYHPHKVRNLGISNTDLHTLQALHSEMKVKPAVVQNRFYKDTKFESRMRSFCRDNGIVFQSFWTLSINKHLVQSTPVLEVARATGVGLAPAYYALVLGLDNITILDGTTSEEHMSEDLRGIERVGVWAEDEVGAARWQASLEAFKTLIHET